MNWKRNIQLRDLEPEQKVELACQSCSYVRFTNAGDLIKSRSDQNLYLDEVETRLSCGHRGCTGRVILALLHQGKVSGFIGGMP